VKIPAMREFMHWHRSMDGDPMHRWLRERIGDIIHSLDQHPEQHRRAAAPGRLTRAPPGQLGGRDNPAAPSRFDTSHPHSRLACRPAAA
jgi:hypothetical protein